LLKYHFQPNTAFGVALLEKTNDLVYRLHTVFKYNALVNLCENVLIIVSYKGKMAKKLKTFVGTGIAVVKLGGNEINISRYKVNLLVSVMYFGISALNVVHSDVGLTGIILLPIGRKGNRSEGVYVHLKSCNVSLKNFFEGLSKTSLLHVLSSLR
jgi:hypothetical protein